MFFLLLMITYLDSLKFTVCFGNGKNRTVLDWGGHLFYGIICACVRVREIIIYFALTFSKRSLSGRTFFFLNNSKQLME